MLRPRTDQRTGPEPASLVRSAERFFVNPESLSEPTAIPCRLQYHSVSVGGP